jgi:ParB-like chromosome segregation protein Spo0J
MKTPAPTLFPVSSIVPYARNSKLHPKEQVDKIARQISEVGFLVPIIVDKDRVVIAGHGRLEAAKSLGLEQVPVIVADHLTEGQAKAFRIADNKVAESEWDFPMLAFELGSLEHMELDLTLSGFDMQEARSILQSINGSDPSGLPGGAGSPKTGATELSEDDFQEFQHTCPKCSFQWN